MCAPASAQDYTVTKQQKPLILHSGWALTDVYSAYIKNYRSGMCGLFFSHSGRPDGQAGEISRLLSRSMCASASAQEYSVQQLKNELDLLVFSRYWLVGWAGWPWKKLFFNLYDTTDLYFFTDFQNVAIYHPGAIPIWSANFYTFWRTYYCPDVQKYSFFTVYFPIVIGNLINIIHF